jgi:alpha-tubulin suppressor-like RCC1 family protein
MARRLALLAGLSIGLLACNEPTRPSVLPPGQFVAVSAGRYHACAIDTIGRGWCWGDNSYGQAGSGAGVCALCKAGPAPLPTELRFTSISAGSSHTCGLIADGSAYCWGDNSSAQLGVGTVETCSNNRVCSPTPLAVSGGHRFKSITAGSAGTCGITTDDVLKCWGYQGFSNNLVFVQPSTVQLPATGDSVWSFVGATDAGLNGCALTQSSLPVCWGVNFFGQLGIGSINNSRSNPIPITIDAVIRSISSGSGYSCALSTLGDAYCWGISYRGGLGVGADAVASPCQVVAPDACFPSPTKVVGGRKFSELAVGPEHVCGIDIASGETYCWGSNTFFAIGAETLGHNPVAPSPFAAANGTKYTHITAGWHFTCGLMADKHISCWGSNIAWQLGQPTSLYETIVPLIITAVAP